MRYKTLNTKHQDYDDAQIHRQDLLYRGGYAIAKEASTFLQKLRLESPKSYHERLTCSAYLPYMSQFVDSFASSLFASELTVKQDTTAPNPNTPGTVSQQPDFYMEFKEDCDDNGTSLHNMMHDAFREALYLPSIFVGVDFPQLQDQNVNLLEEDAQGSSRGYLYEIDPCTVINWKKNTANQKFMWVTLKSCLEINDDPLTPPMKQEEFKIWTLVNGVATWRLFRTRVVKPEYEFKDTEEIPEVASGSTSFLEVPVFELKVPDGLHLGNRLGPVCEEYYQRRSFLVSNMNKTNIAVPVAFMGDEIGPPGGAITSEVQSDPGRADNLRQKLEDQGIIVLGGNDKFQITEAHGASHALADKQLKELVEQMLQIISLMANSVNNNSKAMGRSAASKQADHHATEILLTAYATVVRDFVRELYKCLSQALGDDVNWVPGGLSTFVEEDRQVLIQEAIQMPLVDIPSITFKQIYNRKIAMALLTDECSPEEQDQIKSEIEAGTKEQEQQKQEEHDLMMQGQQAALEPGGMNEP